MKNFLLLLSIISLPLSVRAKDFEVYNGIELQAALSEAGANLQDDVIYLASGIYSVHEVGGFPFTYTPFPGETYSLALRGDPTQLTIFNGEGESQIFFVDASITSLAPEESAEFSFEDLWFTQGGVLDPQFDVGGGMAIYTKDISVRVERCKFASNYGSSANPGLFIRSIGETGIEVNRSVFSQNSSGYGSGLTIEADGGIARVESSLFHANHALLSSGGGASIRMGANGEVDLVNNVFYGNQVDTYYGGGLHAQLYPGAELYAIHNTIVGNRADGLGGGVLVYSSESGAALHFHNNIIYGNSSNDAKSQDVYFYDYSSNLQNPTGTSIEFSHNDVGHFYSACQDDSDCAANTSIHVANNFDFDPQLSLPNALDFSLAPSSPAIDLGDDLAPKLPALDYRGQPRLQGEAVDLGAIEFDGEPQGQPTATPSASPSASPSGEPIVEGTPSPGPSVLPGASNPTILNGGGCSLQIGASAGFSGSAWAGISLSLAALLQLRRLSPSAVSKGAEQ